MTTNYKRFLFLLVLLLIGGALIPVAAQDQTDIQPGTPSDNPSPYQVGADSGLHFGRSAPNQQTHAFVAPTLNPAETNSPRQMRQALNVVPQSNRPMQTTEQPVSGTIMAMIVLNRAPALTGITSLTPSTMAAAQSTAASIQAAQSTLTASLNSLGGIRVAGSLRFSANALVVSMDASQIAAVEALPGVSAVVPDQIGYYDNAHSVPFINAVSAWEAAGGNTGSGIRIGIIDSGIDYTHANFGGSGDVTHFTGQDNTDITDIGYDGSKVVTGFDFVGSAWAGGAFTGTGGSPLGSAWVFGAGDDDPLDCFGHGSHVAGTAAGFGVDDLGNTFAGPWDSTVPFDTMTIGPGVAPEADLYALKIGGCSNSVSFDAASLALEFALDPNGDSDISDHLDVLNNSYGGSYGTPLEILSQQMDLVSSAGIIVVAAAGNAGDTYFVNGDPSTSEWAISAAASVSDTVYGGLEITTGDSSFPSYPTVIAANPSQGGALGSVWSLRPAFSRRRWQHAGLRSRRLCGFCRRSRLDCLGCQSLWLRLWHTHDQRRQRRRCQRLGRRLGKSGRLPLHQPRLYFQRRPLVDPLRQCGGRRRRTAGGKSRRFHRPVRRYLNGVTQRHGW